MILLASAVWIHFPKRTPKECVSNSPRVHLMFAAAQRSGRLLLAHLLKMWVWLRIKRSEGQAAGIGIPCFYLPIGQPILEFRVFEPQPCESVTSCQVANLCWALKGGTTRYMKIPRENPPPRARRGTCVSWSWWCCIPALWTRRLGFGEGPFLGPRVKSCCHALHVYSAWTNMTLVFCLKSKAEGGQLCPFP